MLKKWIASVREFGPLGREKVDDKQVITEADLKRGIRAKVADYKSEGRAADYSFPAGVRFNGKDSL